MQSRADSDCGVSEKPRAMSSMVTLPNLAAGRASTRAPGSSSQKASAASAALSPAKITANWSFAGLNLVSAPPVRVLTAACTADSALAGALLVVPRVKEQTSSLQRKNPSLIESKKKRMELFRLNVMNTRKRRKVQRASPCSC